MPAALLSYQQAAELLNPSGTLRITARTIQRWVAEGTLL